MKFLITLVVYQENYKETKTYKSLINSGIFEDKTSFFIYDNSKFPQKENTSLTYIHNPDNPGIAAAYNAALRHAQANQYEWLLLLDQDTELTSDYLHLLLNQSDNLDPNIVALAPIIYDKNEQISPISNTTVKNKLKKTISSGIYEKDIMCISSASFIKVSFLDKINGFNTEFPLDYLDHWLYWKIFQEKKKVKILPSSIQHNLSVLDMDNMPLIRYKSILKAEQQFFRNYQKNLYSSYTTHLFLRGCKQLLRVPNKKIALLTFTMWVKNLFT